MESATSLRQGWHDRGDRDAAGGALLGDLSDNGAAQWAMAQGTRRRGQRVPQLHADRHAMGRQGRAARAAKSGAGRRGAGHAVQRHAGDLHPEQHRPRQRPGIVRQLPQLRDPAGQWRHHVVELQLPAGPRRSAQRAQEDPDGALAGAPKCSSTWKRRTR